MSMLRIDHLPLHVAIAELESLRRACEISAEGLQKVVDPLHLEMDEALAILDVHEQDAYLRDINDYYIELHYTLPRLLWYAHFSTAYALFEKGLNDACLHARQQGGYDLDLRDIAGTGIHRARTFLKKVAKVDRPFETSEWATTLLYGEIRNRIVHNGGLFESDNKSNSLFQRASKLAGAKFDDDLGLHETAGRQIMLSAEFVHDASAKLENLLSLVHREILNTPR
jgi:hypothetical protein